jgi:hypothetical protein
MSQPGDPIESLSDADIRLEYQAMLEFMHLAPIGLVRTNHEGVITMMNPMATQLLAPLGFGLGDPNLLTMMDKITPDLRQLLRIFQGSSGVVCDKHRVLMPEHLHSAAVREAPIALSVTLLQLAGPNKELMAVITDDSSELKLQRMRASWMR